MQKPDPIYSGSSRIIDTKYGPMTTVTQTKKELQDLLSYINQHDLDYVTSKIKEKKNKVEGKPPYYLEVDTWRPDKTYKKSVPKVEPTDELDF